MVGFLTTGSLDRLSEIFTFNEETDGREFHVLDVAETLGVE